MASPSTAARRPRAATTTKRPTHHIGHTCSWTVPAHLCRNLFHKLKTFCQIHPSQAASIRRKQLEMAVRATADETERRLKLVRYDVLDTSDENADAHPVVARADRTYKLVQNLFGRTHGPTYEALKHHYDQQRGTIHTTVACGIVKRYVRDRLFGLSLRNHGGVYFVSDQREEEMFALLDFLEDSGVGHITRITVGGDPQERAMVTEEIRRSVDAQIEAIRDAFEDADLSDPKDREKLRAKVAGMRDEIAEMQQLFSFARETLSAKDAQARSLMKSIIRGRRTLPKDLFGDVADGGKDHRCQGDLSTDDASTDPRTDEATPPADFAGDGAATRPPALFAG